MRGPHRVDEAVAGGIFVVVQVSFGALPFGPGVEGIDEHAGDRAWARDFDAGFFQIIGHRRNPPVAGVDLTGGRRAWRDPPCKGPRQHLPPPGSELVCPGCQLVVQAYQILREDVGEELRGPFHGGEAHARRGGLRVRGHAQRASRSAPKPSEAW